MIQWAPEFDPTDPTAELIDDEGNVHHDGEMKAGSSLTDLQWAAGLIELTELQTGDNTDRKLWLAAVPSGLPAARYACRFRDSADPTPDTPHLGTQDDPSGYMADQVADLFSCDIRFTADADNDQDEYTAWWRKNGALVTSGVTDAKIQVIKRADGTDLVAETAMTEIGSSGAQKYDESTNRAAADEAILVICTATIDGATRTWGRVFDRDT